MFKANLLGIKDNEVDIAVTGDRLTISGHLYDPRACSYAGFTRAFTLPEGSSGDNTDPRRARCRRVDGDVLDRARRRSAGALGMGGRGRSMITLRRAEERHHDSRRKHEVWLTFDAQDRTDPLADGFGALQILDEDRLSPGADASAPTRSRRRDRHLRLRRRARLRRLHGAPGRDPGGRIPAHDRRDAAAASTRRTRRGTTGRTCSRSGSAPPQAGRRPRPRAEALQHGGAPGRALRRRLARRAPRIAAHSPGRPAVLGDARPGQARRPRAARGAKRLASPRRGGGHPRRPRPLQRRRRRPHRRARGVAHGARRDRNPARSTWARSARGLTTTGGVP